MRAISRTGWALLRAALLVGVVALVIREIVPEWPEITAALRRVELRAAPLALSGALVLVSYALLIEVWRRVVGGLGGRMSYAVAARIWFVSNLGKYIPGKVWSIAAMGAMSAQAGVSAPAAVASSLLIAVINVLAGVAVVALAGREALALSTPGVVALTTCIAVLVLAPRLIPAAARWVGARFGRLVEWPPLAPSALLTTFIGCGAAWVLYGVAFQLLVAGTVGVSSGATPAYVAVFTASYLAGFLVLPAPGGLGVREAAMTALLATFALATVATATVIVVASRLWLTVFELIPGLVLLALTPRPGTTAPTAPTSQPTINTVENE